MRRFALVLITLLIIGGCSAKAEKTLVHPSVISPTQTPLVTAAPTVAPTAVTTPTATVTKKQTIDEILDGPRMTEDEIKAEEAKTAAEKAELVFKPEYSESVKITDARKLMKHIDIVVHNPEDFNSGAITQAAFTEAYYFLQLEAVKSVKTVTIGVMRGKFRIAQITIDVAKFKPEDHLIHSVMKASKIDKMFDEVTEYGKNMELW